MGCMLGKPQQCGFGPLLAAGFAPFLVLQIALLLLFKSGREMMPLSQLGRDDHGYV